MKEESSDQLNLINLKVHFMQEITDLILIGLQSNLFDDRYLESVSLEDFQNYDRIFN